MQDFLFVKVLESRHNLPEVVSDFWLCQHLSCFQDVSHGLEREGGGENLSNRVTQTRLPFAGLVIQVGMVGELSVTAKTPGKMSSNTTSAFCWSALTGVSTYPPTAVLQENVNVFFVFKVVVKLHHMLMMQDSVKLDFFVDLRIKKKQDKAY